MIYEILLGGRKVAYELIRKKVKNINLRIYRDGTIKVSASSRVSVEAIEKFIRSREDFILKVLLKFESAEVKSKRSEQLSDNECVRLFDKSLTLKVRNAKRNGVEIIEDELWLFVRDVGDEKLKRKVLDEFLKDVLLERISPTVSDLLKRLEPCGVEAPEIKLRRMKSRWGSCNTAKGIVTINTALVEYPAECLAFVLAHELCHLVHPNHSKDFYSILSSIMPEWKIYKAMLK